MQPESGSINVVTNYDGEDIRSSEAGRRGNVALSCRLWAPAYYSLLNCASHPSNIYCIKIIWKNLVMPSPLVLLIPLAFVGAVLLVRRYLLRRESSVHAPRFIPKSVFHFNF